MDEVKVRLFGEEWTLKCEGRRFVCKMGGDWLLGLFGNEPTVYLELHYRDEQIQEGSDRYSHVVASSRLCATPQEAADSIERMLRPLGRWIAHPVHTALDDGYVAMAADVEHQLSSHADNVPDFLRALCGIVVESHKFFCMTDEEMDKYGW